MVVYQSALARTGPEEDIKILSRGSLGLLFRPGPPDPASLSVETIFWATNCLGDPSPGFHDSFIRVFINRFRLGGHRGSWIGDRVSGVQEYGVDRGSGIGPVLAQAGPGLPGGTGGDSVALGAFNSVSCPPIRPPNPWRQFFGPRIALGIPRRDSSKGFMSC